MPLAPNEFNQIVNRHDNFLAEVEFWLNANDFYTDKVAYHDKMSDEVKERIMKMYNTTCEYLRHRMDRIAIHKTKDVGFEWDAKTNKGNYNDLTIDLIPFAYSISKASLGIKCLYVFKNKNTLKEIGFWADELPKIKCVMIPTQKWTEGQIKHSEAIAQVYLPNIDIVYPPFTNGSDDPFIIIKQEELEKCSEWKSLVLASF